MKYEIYGNMLGISSKRQPPVPNASLLIIIAGLFASLVALLGYALFLQAKVKEQDGLISQIADSLQELQKGVST